MQRDSNIPPLVPDQEENGLILAPFRARLNVNNPQFNFGRVLAVDLTFPPVYSRGAKYSRGIYIHGGLNINPRTPSFNCFAVVFTQPIGDPLDFALAIDHAQGNIARGQAFVSAK